MDWYYSQNNQQQGPVTRERLQELVNSGEVKPFDLVWNDTMTDWVPLGSLSEFVPPPAAEAPILSSAGSAPQSAAPAGGSIVHSYDPPGPPPSAGTNGLAIAALVLGIASFVLCCGCLTGIPAIICGHIALSQISRQQPFQGGRGLAIAGLVLGYISLVFTVATWILSSTPAYQEMIQELMKELEATQQQ
jgi:hypothetical protein